MPFNKLRFNLDVMSRIVSQKMRVYHRYLGFFLAGIMAVYAISGIVLIFRNTNTFKRESKIEKVLSVGLSEEDLGKQLRIRGFKVEKTDGEVLYFKNGQYNNATGQVKYLKNELPYLLDKMTHMHKATTDHPLFYLNIFFGLSLLFYVVSSFWMFLPGSDAFKKGLYFVGAGILLALIMIFI